MNRSNTSQKKADLVGSFLRPERLKVARADYESGKITLKELGKTEDERF